MFGKAVFNVFLLFALFPKKIYALLKYFKVLEKFVKIQVSTHAVCREHFALGYMNDRYLTQDTTTAYYADQTNRLFLKLNILNRKIRRNQRSFCLKKCIGAVPRLKIGSTAEDKIVQQTILK